MKKAKLDEKKEQGTSTQRTQESFVVRIFNFFNQYNKIIYGIAIGLLVIIVALLAFNKFYLAPRTEKASAMMTAPIEFMMKADSLSLVMALEGDDEHEGFLSIASSFRFTRTANTARYLAGMCYLGLGDKEEALNYLLKFKRKDDIYWFGAQATIGNLYDDQGDTKKAIRYYRRAVGGNDPYLTPANLFKLGQLYEREGDWRKAVTAYETIQKDFFTEYQKMGVDRFLERALINRNK
ncbi:MAG: tetratricopeptide repeat protein [Bacteroidetes bacterium]|nr:tetratricopeptide repeat protein [Bacteroidota bacterium]MCL2302796.1 tetratricopeptide repeat protein [Lentimicrobiaceae bacterium]